MRMKEECELELLKTQSSKNSVVITSSFLRTEEVNNDFIYRFSKRLIDILGSLIGVVMLFPLLLFVAIAIKREEKEGPVFFSQIRVGKDGKKFKMYKFRSMCVDAEDKLRELLKYNEIDGAMFKMKDDPRVTTIGKFIRKTSIDELPQLLNVLKGDMSLVGPRPPLEREVINYSTYDRQRLLIKPGCTGLWQISGRNNVSFFDMIELDLKYIKQQSLINDIKIIIKTVYIMIKPNGAY
ncbi:sugar transferase [Marinilactibacillus piezotolerans]|uniref:sugar transferase n=1 Tax=Marinilactibacillus piezotolerans TaxID=258723 RepID=UPI0009B16DBC|nr:sugar transferase [Marinilactibacillus piezotolerans]